MIKYHFCHFCLIILKKFSFGIVTILTIFYEVKFYEVSSYFMIEKRLPNSFMVITRKSRFLIVTFKVRVSNVHINSTISL